LTYPRALSLVLPIVGALALAACQQAGSDTAKTPTVASPSIVQVNGLAIAGIDGLRDLAISSARIAEASETCSLATKDLDKRISDIDGVLPALPNLAQGWFEGAYKAERKAEAAQRSATCSEDTDRVHIAQMLTRLQNDLNAPAFTNWLTTQLGKK
jgi:hypothetical protein